MPLSIPFVDMPSIHTHSHSLPLLLSPKMICKSVETRDWLNTMEPCNICSVMRRLVEEVTTIDKQVGLLYEEGIKKTEGSGEM